MARSSQVPPLGINLDGVLLPLSQSLGLFNRELGIVAEGISKLGRSLEQLSSGKFGAAISSATAGLGLFKTAAERFASAVPGSAAAIQKPFEILTATIGVALVPAFSLLGAAALTISDMFLKDLKANIQSVAEAYGKFAPKVADATVAVYEFAKSLKDSEWINPGKNEAGNWNLPRLPGQAARPVMPDENGLLQNLKRLLLDEPARGLALDMRLGKSRASMAGGGPAGDLGGLGRADIPELFRQGGVAAARGAGGGGGGEAAKAQEGRKKFLDNWETIIKEMVASAGGKGGATDILGARRGLQQASFMSPFEKKMLELQQEEIKLQRMALEEARKAAVVR